VFFERFEGPMQKLKQFGEKKIRQPQIRHKTTTGMFSALHLFATIFTLDFSYLDNKGNQPLLPATPVRLPITTKHF